MNRKVRLFCCATRASFDSSGPAAPVAAAVDEEAPLAQDPHGFHFIVSMVAGLTPGVSAHE